jgi:beta-lactamase class A
MKSVTGQVRCPLGVNDCLIAESEIPADRRPHEEFCYGYGSMHPRSGFSASCRKGDRWPLRPRSVSPKVANNFGSFQSGLVDRSPDKTTAILPFLVLDMKLAAFSVLAALATSAVGQRKPEAVPGDTGNDLLWKTLEARVEHIATRLDGVMGVTVLDLTNGRILLHNADRVFPAASSIKLAILLQLYRQDQEARTGAQGKAKLDDSYTFDPKDLVEDSRIMAGLTPGATQVTNRDLAQFMIAVSDNSAANILYDRVGRGNVNAMLRDLGLSKTMLRRKMMDVAAARRGEENVATPQEMVRLLEAIHKGKMLNKQSTTELIKQLSTLKQSYIPCYLPDCVQVANKPGELEGVRTDSGIIFAQNRPFAMSVMTAYNRDEKAAEHAISEVALEAFHYFEMRGKTSQYGRILPPAEPTK